MSGANTSGTAFISMATSTRAGGLHCEQLIGAILPAGVWSNALPRDSTSAYSAVVASELEVDAQGLFTGRFVEPLCLGNGKIVRARRFAEEHGFTLAEAAFYTDSYTDLPLLEVVAEPVIVNPDPRLERLAKKRGWRIEEW